MIWDELSSMKIGSLDKRIPVLLPLAATEQHGPHLPLATDRLIAEYFCRRLHQRLPDQVLILPTVSIGCSEHHMDFAGSLTLTHTTFMQQVTDILESVTAHGFTNLLLFNAHGGNLAIGKVIVESFGKRHPQCRVAMATWWQIAAEKLFELTETGAGGIGHACEFETSLMLVIAPELVDAAQIASGYPRPTLDWATADMLRGSKATLYATFRQMTENGVYGDPTAATRDKGEAIGNFVEAELLTITRSLFG